jgi:hypothetical protein
MKIALKTAVALTVVVASVGGAAAQMWSEDMSNGARSNPNSQYVQPRATRNAAPGYGVINQSATQRDNYGRRGNLNPYARSDRDTWGR